MLYYIALLCTFIGGLNWGIVGISNVFGKRFDLIEWVAIDVFNIPVLGNIIYIVIGIATIVALVLLKDHL